MAAELDGLTLGGYNRRYWFSGALWAFSSQSRLQASIQKDTFGQPEYWVRVQAPQTSTGLLASWNRARGAHNASIAKGVHLARQIQTQNANLRFLWCFASGMEFTKVELEKFDFLISHVIYGPLREDLIDERYKAGSSASLSIPGVDEAGFRAYSTRSGAVHARSWYRLSERQ